MSSTSQRMWVRLILMLLGFSLLGAALVVLRSRTVALEWHAYRFRQARRIKNWTSASTHLGVILKQNLMLGVERNDAAGLLDPPDEKGRLAPIFDCWLLNANHRLLCEFDARAVLEYLSKETALHFEREERPSRILYVEKGQE